MGPLHGNDGNVAYRTIMGTTFFYTIDRAKPKRGRSRLQQINSHLLTLMNHYTYYHYGDLIAYFPQGKYRSGRHAFMAKNKAYLAEALRPLAERMADGEFFSDQEIDVAVSAFAELYPGLIEIGQKAGYKTVYLEGAWPEKFVFYRYEQTPCEVCFEQPDGSFTSSESAENDNTAMENDVEMVKVTTVASPIDGGVTIGGGEVERGAVMRISVVANRGYRFVGWSDGNLSAQRIVKAEEDRVYTALFAAVNDEAKIQ